MAAVLSLKSGQCRSDTIEDTLDIHINHLFPFLDFIGGKWRQRHQPRIVDEHVESAETLDGRLHKRFDLFALRHIHCSCQRLASSGYDLIDNFVQMTLATGTECDLRALCRQMTGNSFAMPLLAPVIAMTLSLIFVFILKPLRAEWLVERRNFHDSSP